MKKSKLILLILLNIGCISILSAQTTVSKTWSNPATTTIDGTGNYQGTLGTVLFTAADLPSCETVTNVEVDIVWAKTAGTCDAPGTGNSYHDESSFRLDGPTGAQVIIATDNTWSGATSTSLTTMTFADGFFPAPSGAPMSGTFTPNESFSAFDNLDPLGAWELKPGDTGGGDPMCVTEYTVRLTLSPPNLGANLISVDAMANCTVGDGETKTFMNGLDYLGQIEDVAGGSFLGDTEMSVIFDGAPIACNDTYYLGRHWRVDVNGTNGPANVKVYATDAEMSALATALGHPDISAMVGAGLDITAFSAADPADEGCSGNPANYTNTLIPSTAISSNDPAPGIWSVEFGVSSFSTFYLHGSNGMPLPVELASFTGRNAGETNQLKWSTASEIDFSHFEVERRNENSEFENIGKVAAAGSTAQASHYDFEDRNPFAGENYYRLKMVDLDASYEYSHIIKLETDKNHIVSYYPNPAKNLVALNIYSKDIGTAIFTVHDVTGKQVRGEHKEIREGNSVQELDLDGLPKGLYIVKVIMPNSNSPISIKILKE